MKSIRRILTLIAIGFITLGAVKVKAQCQSVAAVESTESGSTTANGLNKGIIYLLVAPYLSKWQWA